MERNLVQVEYEHNYSWHSISGYRLSDRLILTASLIFATSDPPSGISVTVADQQRIPAVLTWTDQRNGAALLRIDGRPPSSPVTAFQWGELGTVHGKFGCEVRYLQPGPAAIERFPAFLDPHRRDEEHNYLLDVHGRPLTVPSPDGRSSPQPMTGGAVICGREAFSGLVLEDRNHYLVVLPAERLLADRSFMRAYDQNDHWPITRGPVRGHAPATYAAILALSLTIAAFYVNFLQTKAQVTVTIIDIFVLSLVTWRFLIWLLQTRREVGPRHISARWTAGIAVSLAGAATLTGVIWVPEGAENTSAPYCMYEVSAHHPPADSFPITKGGYVEQAFRPTATAIDAISPVIGIDPAYSHTDVPHPMTLELRDASGKSLDPPVSVPDINDNGFTRFNLPETLHLDLRATYYMRIINSSSETVGIYLDPVSEGDIVTDPDPDHGAWIVGQIDVEGGYRKPAWALSGCIEAVSVS